MVNEEKLKKILPLMFREIKPSEQAKKNLRERLFAESGKSAMLSDDDFADLAAAGEFSEEYLNKLKNDRKG